MRSECVSADEAAIGMHDVRAGHGWRFGLVTRDGHRDIAPDGVEEDPGGRQPASFVAIAGASMVALRQARPRGLIDR